MDHWCLGSINRVRYIHVGTHTARCRSRHPDHHEHLRRSRHIQSPLDVSTTLRTYPEVGLLASAHSLSCRHPCLYHSEHQSHKAVNPKTPNQSLERTTDRHENLFPMTSIIKPEAEPAFVS